MSNPTETSGSADVSPAERWYLRIDGHDYGPVARDRIEQFLEPPRLCNVMEVKCGDDANWFVIARHETIDKVLVKAGVAPEPAPEINWQVPTPSLGAVLARRLRDHFENGASWAIDHWVVLTGVLVFASVNAALLIALQDPQGRDREILVLYEAIWSKAQQFDGATEQTEQSDDWRTFANSALAQLEPVVSELERSANVHHPIRQNLLFAGRDHLSKVLKAERSPTATAQDVVLFERRLQHARRQLPVDSAKAEGAQLGLDTGRSKGGQ